MLCCCVRYRPRVLLLLFLVASALVCVADNVEVYYENYMNSSDGNKIAAANHFFQELDRIEYTDSLFHFPANASLATVSSQVNYWMADYYYNLSKYDQSIEVGERALLSSARIKDEALKSDIFSVLGIAHYRKGYFETALDYFEQGYAIDQRMADDERMSSDLNNIAGVYLATRQPDAGITYIQRAIDLERKMHRNDRLAIRLGMASELYLGMKEYEKALDMARRAYEIDKQENRPSKAAVRLSQIAAVYIEMQQYPEAQSALNTASPQFEQDGSKNSLAICYRLQGKLLHAQGKSSQAASYYERALEMSREMGNHYEEREDERGLWETLRDVDQRASLHHLERYSILVDSMFKAESARQLGMFRTKYHTDELVRANEQMEARNRWILIIALVLTLFLVSALLAAIYALRQKSRATRLAKEIDSLRSGFVSNISNELRNPLSVILGVGNQLRSSPDTSVQDQGDVIVRQGETLMELVDELIGVSRITSPIADPDWRHGDVVTYLRMIVDNYHDVSVQNSVTLQFHPEDNSVSMDFVPEYLSKLMHHLLSNALTYTSRGGHVAVGVSKKGTSLRIVVEDDGCGISADDLPRIYDPFYRGDNAADKPGFGVGLSLVKKIVTTMNGEIAVDSEQGKGTVFTVTLPLEQSGVTSRPFLAPPSKDSATAHQEQSDASKPVVLIVESNTDMAFYVGTQLSTHYKVFYARNGVEGIDKVQDLVPDLVITAQQMPQMNGYELCQILRSTDTVSHIPVIMLSAQNGNEDRIRGIASGADAYLVKPFSGNELLSLADNLLQQRKALREKFTANVDMATAHADTPSSKSDQEFLNKLVNLIHSQMSKGDIDIDTIATAMGLSRKQMRVKVQSLTGESTSVYVQRVRMGKAQRLVRTTSASIGEVAQKCGFQDVAHFSRAFKQFFGVTPSQYRKNVD